MRFFQRPIIPSFPDWNFESFLDMEIEKSLAILKEKNNIFSFLINDDLFELICWAKEHSPRNRSSLASRLRAFADYSMYNS
ncbi:hypothetical protein HPC37_10650 [Pasteurellaceae bacterium 20609_3]|nr:hypothetical protein [Spirabiliibacterium mucosae]